jgi:hypothetical protein
LDAVLADAKVFLTAVAVVELEHARGERATAATARGSHIRDGHRFPVPPECGLRDPYRGRVTLSVPEAMAVSAEEVALLDLGNEPCQRAGEVADPELLRRGVAVMELEYRRRPDIAAVLAASASLSHQLLLDALAARLLIPVRLLIPTSAPMLAELLRDADARRVLGRVVGEEW